MTIYFLLIGYISLVGIACYLRKPYKQNANLRFLLLGMFAVFLIQALRSRYVGWDTVDYYYDFFNIQSLTVNQSRMQGDIAYFALQKLVSAFTSNPQIFLAVCSFIILTGIGVFIYKNTEKVQSVFWALFLFIVLTQFFSTMNLLRQSLAMSISINVYTVLCRGRSKKNLFISFLLVLVGFLFHKTAIIMLAIVAVFFLPVNRKMIWILIVGAFSAYFLYPLLLNLFLRILPIFSHYLGSKHEAAATSRIYYILAAIEIIVSILFVVYIDPNKKENIEGYRLVFISMLSLALIVLQRRIELALRLGYYYEIFLILLIPKFVSLLKVQNNRVIWKGAIYFFGLAYFTYAVLSGHGRGCIPYTFFWQV